MPTTQHSYKFILTLICFIGFSDLLSAQQTGTVTQHGYTFTIPDGWVGQMQEDSYLMGSNTEPGIILLVTHPHKTLSELKSEIQSGITDQYSYNFQVVGSIEEKNESQINCQFQGTLGNEQAKGYLVGMIHPDAAGVLVAAITTPQLYSDRYPTLASEIATSLKFPEPAKVPEDFAKTSSHALVQKFMQVKLTYMNSYYSSSYTDGGVSGGYSDEEVISLCSSGYFTYSSSSETTAGGNYSSLYGSDSNQGDGTWKLIPSSNSQGTLILTFNNGQSQKYNVEINAKGETYLNGYRYYRTTAASGADYAPICP